MKVAILIDAWLPFLGGGQKSVLEITKILKQKKKIKFVIFHSLHPHLIVRLFWLFYVIPQVIFYHFFICRFDLIDSRAFLAGLPAKILSLILKIPVIFTVNGCGALDRKTKGLGGQIEKWLLTGIKYHQEISDSQHFLKYKNVNKNILIIANGVNIKEFEKLKVKKNKIFTLIYVGRLAKIKGLNYLLEAIKILKTKRKNFLLKIIGRGEEEKSLKNFVQKNKLNKWVRFIGELKGEKLIREYKMSHLFILPSLAEGQPLTLLEAWAAKLPVLVTKVGSLPFFVNKKNGYLIPPAESQRLASAILKAMRDKKLKEKGRNGFYLVKKRYQWQKTAQTYFKVYQKVLGLVNKE